LNSNLKWGWSIGSVSTMTMYYLVAFQTLYYMTDYLGISPARASAIIFFTKFYDVFTDPIIGILSDRTSSPWGRRRPWLLGGGILSSFACIMVFAGPALSGDHLMAYLACSFIVYFTGYTAFNIPYLSMPAEMTNDYHERTILMSYRTFFVSISGVLASGLAPFLVFTYFGGGLEGYRYMGLIFSVIILAAALACFWGTAGAGQTTRLNKELILNDWLKSIIANKPFMQLILIKLFQLFASGVTFAMMIYLSVHIYKGGEGAVVKFGIPMFAAIGLSIPCWTWLALHMEKRSVFVIATVGKILTIATFVFLTPDEPEIIFIIRTFTFGFFTGGMILMGQSMLPDTIEYDFHRTQLRREGIFASLYSFVEKTSAMLVPLSIGLVLSAGGYIEGLEGAEQSQTAIDAVYFGAIWLPIIGYAASLPLLLIYSLDRQTLGELRKASKEHGHKLAES